MTLDDIPLLEVEPDFATAPRIAGRRSVSFHSRGQSRSIGVFPTGGLQHVLNHRFVFNTRAEARELEDFFNSRCGSWSGFFALGWHAEIEPLQSLAPGGDSLAITAVNYGSVYLAADKKTLTGQYIYLMNRSGEVHYTKVLAASSGSPEVLTLRDPVPDGMNFLVGDYHVGFLYHVRFLADRLALDFSGPDACSCELAMLELVENSASLDDETHDAQTDGPDGGVNAEAGHDGNHYWLRCESPILGPLKPLNPDPQEPGYSCPSTASASLVLPDFGGPRPVTVRIRGVSETKGYTGGVPEGHFYRGGLPVGGGANIFRLTVGSQIFYINYSFGGGGVFAFDYAVEVTMNDGDTVGFQYDSVDKLEYNNAGHYNGGVWTKSGGTLLVIGVPPGDSGFNGQFAQVDFYL